MCHSYEKMGIFQPANVSLPEGISTIYPPDLRETMFNPPKKRLLSMDMIWTSFSFTFHLGPFFGRRGYSGIRVSYQSIRYIYSTTSTPGLLGWRSILRFNLSHKLHTLQNGTKDHMPTSGIRKSVTWRQMEPSSKHLRTQIGGEFNGDEYHGIRQSVNKSTQ